MKTIPKGYTGNPWKGLELHGALSSVIKMFHPTLVSFPPTQVYSNIFVSTSAGN